MFLLYGVLLCNFAISSQICKTFCGLIICKCCNIVFCLSLFSTLVLFSLHVNVSIVISSVVTKWILLKKTRRQIDGTIEKMSVFKGFKLWSLSQLIELFRRSRRVKQWEENIPLFSQVRELYGIPKNSMDTPWNSMDFRFPWISTDF